MAKHILYNASLVANAVDLSDRAESITFVATMNGQPAAAMSEIEDYEMPGTRKVSDITAADVSGLRGVEDVSNADRALDGPHHLQPGASRRTPAPRHDESTVHRPVFVRTLPIISGNRGDRHMSQVVFAPAGLDHRS
jgi:hypothetical protein